MSKWNFRVNLLAIRPCLSVNLITLFVTLWWTPRDKCGNRKDKEIFEWIHLLWLRIEGRKMPVTCLVQGDCHGSMGAGEAWASASA